ncbi:septation protein A [Thalassotalea piscium]|uniref:Inner membrane-spanning protein YciB n=1 Tax=Thalassotalea piscium TaxID=1230533 RepID=A0A7X0NEY8_9GAMM|nr:septation protein A [Thalassotalea piscium]MBB6542150.1 intracellular septation protein [Thalassotalea piscium]
MHAIFEYIPLIVFFIFYKFADIYWATGSLIVTSAIQIGYYLLKKEPIPKRNLIFFGLILIFGGLTIFFHDDAFLKWKVTIINALFAVVLIVSQVVFKKNLIKEMLSEGLPLPDNIWTKLNLAWALFFLLCSLLNIYIAYNFSLETWVNFKVFGLMAMTFVFAIGSILALYKYLPKEEENSDVSAKIDNKPE